jgi:hypothetical protein
MPVISAMPGPLLDWLLQSVRQPGPSQHPRLTTLLPWERTPRAEAFPDALLLKLLHFLKPWIEYPYLRSSK